MERSLWTRGFDANTLPAWPCPTCGRGHVRLVPKTFAFKETAASIKSKGSPDWDPDWIDYVFACWGECTYLSCKEPFAVAGKGGISPYYDEDQEEVWGEHFLATSCQPMPNIFTIPKNCPSEVSEPLMAAFSFFWNDPEACASRMRVSLEAIMNHLGIPRKKKNKNGKYSDLTLHARIEKYSMTNPLLGSQLLALKWLGNTGSHGGGSLSKSELLDAFEILEHALLEIIDERSKRVAALAKKLTKKHSK